VCICICGSVFMFVCGLYRARARAVDMSPLVSPQADSPVFPPSRARRRYRMSCGVVVCGRLRAGAPVPCRAARVLLCSRWRDGGGRGMCRRQLLYRRRRGADCLPRGRLLSPRRVVAAPVRRGPGLGLRRGRREPDALQRRLLLCGRLGATDGLRRWDVVRPGRVVAVSLRRPRGLVLRRADSREHRRAVSCVVYLCGWRRAACGLRRGRRVPGRHGDGVGRLRRGRRVLLRRWWRLCRRRGVPRLLLVRRWSRAAAGVQHRCAGVLLWSGLNLERGHSLPGGQLLHWGRERERGAHRLPRLDGLQRWQRGPRRVHGGAGLRMRRKQRQRRGYGVRARVQLQRRRGCGDRVRAGVLLRGRGRVSRRVHGAARNVVPGIRLRERCPVQCRVQLRWRHRAGGGVRGGELLRRRKRGGDPLHRTSGGLLRRGQHDERRQRLSCVLLLPRRHVAAGALRVGGRGQLLPRVDAERRGRALSHQLLLRGRLGGRGGVRRRVCVPRSGGRGADAVHRGGGVLLRRGLARGDGRRVHTRFQLQRRHRAAGCMRCWQLLPPRVVGADTVCRSRVDVLPGWRRDPLDALRSGPVLQRRDGAPSALQRGLFLRGRRAHGRLQRRARQLLPDREHSEWCVAAAACVLCAVCCVCACVAHRSLRSCPGRLSCARVAREKVYLI
jgi:hypothetical protein